MWIPVTNDEGTGNILLSKVENRAIAVKPGMSSWRNCTIGNMYTNAKAYEENLNSHMLKNSEWGAVAYLTHSQYGRNGNEVQVNDNSDYKTADEGINENPGQSSTGNVYGIYDLSGGAFEYVAAYYNKSDFLINGDSFTSESSIDKEYSTIYTVADIIEKGYMLGDTTYETSGWNGNNQDFVDLLYPFFGRGGNYDDEGIIGIFNFTSYNGNTRRGGFRLCLTI